MLEFAHSVQGRKDSSRDSIACSVEHDVHFDGARAQLNPLPIV